MGSDEFKRKGRRLVRSTDLRAGIGADGDEGQFVRRPAFDEPSFRFADTFGPVSYTHLDVYKRQALAASRPGS